MSEAKIGQLEMVLVVAQRSVQDIFELDIPVDQTSKSQVVQRLKHFMQESLEKIAIAT